MAKLGTKLKNMDQKQQTYLIAGIVIAVVWFAILFVITHYYWVAGHENPWGEVMSRWDRTLQHITAHPFEIFPFPFKALSSMLLWTLVFGVVLFMMLSKTLLMKHENRDTVMGDAHFMNKKEMTKFHTTYSEPFGQAYADDYHNMLLSDKMAISIRSQGQRESLNLNMLVIGGSGIGKSFRVIGPNILQRNASYVITDPSGGLYHSYGALLEYFGYRVKVFNTDRMSESNHYNPFRYIHSDKDIEILVTMIITNTTAPEGGKGDQFWEKCETALFCALIGYLYHYGEPEQQNFSNIMRLIRAANVDENNSDMESPLDKMFQQIRRQDEDSFTITQYDTFRLGAGKTLKSILISAAVRLQAFDLDIVRELTDTDDIHLDTIADEKTALFIIIPTGEKTFNFLAGIMYSQLFDQLYRYCENTSKFSQCIIDGNGNDEVFKTFRAENKEDAKRAKEEANKWLAAIKSPDAKVELMEKMDIKDDNDDHPRKLDMWAIKNSKDEIVGYRGTKELALQALDEMRHAVVVGNDKRFNKGESCPVHVSFLLDEFANTGKIPSFVEKISTMRKYEISVVIILQSITQIKNLFEKDWSTIAANCDSLVYLGGGADVETTEWLNKLLGKKTVRSMSESFSKNGGSSSIQSQGIDLYSMSQMRTMEKIKCLILIQGQQAVFSDMYNTLEHKDWNLMKSMPNYTFSSYRQLVIRKAFGEDDALSGGGVVEQEIPGHGSIQPEAPDDKAVRENHNKEAEEKVTGVQQGHINLDESPAITDVTQIDPISEPEKVAEALGVDEEGLVSEESSEQLVSADVLSFSFDDGMELDFDEAGMA